MSSSQYTARPSEADDLTFDQAVLVSMSESATGEPQENPVAPPASGEPDQSISSDESPSFPKEGAQLLEKEKQPLEEEKVLSDEEKKLMAEISDLKAKIAAAEEQLPELNNIVKECTAKSDAADARSEALSNELDKLSDLRDAMVDQRDNMQDHRDSLRDTLDDLKDERSDLVDERSDELDEDRPNQSTLARIAQRIQAINGRIREQKEKIAAQELAIRGCNPDFAAHDQAMALKRQEIEKHSRSVDSIASDLRREEGRRDRLIRNIKVWTRELAKLEAKLAGQPEPGPEINVVQLSGEYAVCRFESGPQGPCRTIFRRNGMIEIRSDNGGLASMGPNSVSSYGSGCSIQRLGYGWHQPSAILRLHDGEGVVYACGARIEYDHLAEAGGLIRLNVCSFDTIRVIVKEDTVEIWNASNMPESMQ